MSSKHVKSPAIANNAPIASGQGTPVKRESLVIQGSQHITFTSPLPPAEFINEYARINPTAPQLLLDLFVKQTKHRIECEEKSLNAQITTKKRGQFFGFVFALSALAAGVLAIIHNQPWVAGGIFLTTIPFCAVVFILGKEPSGRTVEKMKQPPRQTEDK